MQMVAEACSIVDVSLAASRACDTDRQRQLRELSVKSDATIHVDRLPGDRAGLV